MRSLVYLTCEETGHVNYVTTKNKSKTPDKIRKKKYSPAVRKHTWHVEKR